MSDSKDRGTDFVNCPRCGSPVPFLDGTLRIRCPYCGLEINVEEEVVRHADARQADEMINRPPQEKHEVRSIYEIQHRGKSLADDGEGNSKHTGDMIRKVFGIIIGCLIFITMILLIISLISTGA